jgi:selenide,water dikinase
LAQVLRPLQNLFDPADSPNLMVGLGIPDDAAVYRLDDDRVLIFTTDFFTPIVDDPYTYGAIAAANALSDVYAMGGTPLLALNLVAFPADLPPYILSEVLRGGAEKVREANAVLAGGHTIQDKEPKYGLAVVGLGHPDHLMTKAGAKPGDVLILTKPLGTGTITTATKRGLVEQSHLDEAAQWMSTLNRAAAEAGIASGAHAITDITGFGFIGHASEVAIASDVSLHISFDKVPFMEGAQQYAQQWIFPGGSSNNQQAFEGQVQFDSTLRDEERMLLFDAQTSGGLLISLPENQLENFSRGMDQRSAAWWQIGRVEPAQEQRIILGR